MNDQELAPTLRQATLLRLFMDSLSERVQRNLGHWFSLLMSFALFAYALVAPADWRQMGMRLLGAAVFTALVHVRWRREKEEPK
jgi:hypothetical protein